MAGTAKNFAGIRHPLKIRDSKILSVYKVRDSKIFRVHKVRDSKILRVYKIAVRDCNFYVDVTEAK